VIPPLEQTGWEETTALAVAMGQEPQQHLISIMAVNLPLAGRIALQPEVRSHLSASQVSDLAAQLAARSEDPDGDLRDRIACAEAVAGLGDPRWQHAGRPEKPYLMPPTLKVPAGVYPIGDDEPMPWRVAGSSGTSTAHCPLHRVPMRGFRISRYPVTNGEWQAFVEAAGYDDPQWWTTEDGQRWRSGEIVAEPAKEVIRIWRGRFQQQEGLLEQMAAKGLMGHPRAPGDLGGDKVLRYWREWLALNEPEFEAALRDQWTPKRETQPRFWTDRRYNAPTQPVVGICWYEAQAYCAWLTAQLGEVVRLPTEVEWEAAARGSDGRIHPWGDEPGRLRTFLHGIKSTTPVGVFVEGNTPEGLSDMVGNVYQWTSSLFGAGALDDEEPYYRYPYDSADGREEASAPPNVRRVLRAGGWLNDRSDGRSAFREHSHPSLREIDYGMRLVIEDGWGDGA
jgi:formylglycine-generating enzyme required for sulfatase activity